MPSIPCLHCAPGVQFARIAPGGFKILAAFVGAVGFIGRDLTITAGTDHHVTGRHPLGEAYDLRVRDLKTDQIVDVFNFLTRELGAAFTVLYESPHVMDDPRLAAIAFINPAASAAHVHVQVKRGTSYPPTDTPAGTLRA